LPGGQLPPLLWRWHIDLLSQKEKRKQKKQNDMSSKAK
jgi:hypothetical protein